MLPILSTNELRKISEAIEKGENEIESTLDLGLTKTKIRLSKEGFYVSDKLLKIPKLREDDKCCYAVVEDELQKIQFFSSETNSLYKLIPTTNKPLLQVSGTSMHKKAFISRVGREKLNGKILDAGTGLGYTAITASKTADEVITVEIDKTIIEIQKLNPYSQELFTNKKIKTIAGDIAEEIKKFKNNEFDFIIFDAGTPKSSGDFFSLNNYKEAFRVLKKGGKLYHYLPMHQILRGRDFGGEVIRRIKEAGFSKIERNTKDSYAVCRK